MRLWNHLSRCNVSVYRKEGHVKTSISHGFSYSIGENSVWGRGVDGFTGN